jgi:hypothetical protein
MQMRQTFSFVCTIATEDVKEMELTDEGEVCGVSFELLIAC